MINYLIDNLIMEKSLENYFILLEIRIGGYTFSIRHNYHVIYHNINNDKSIR